MLNPKAKTFSPFSAAPTTSRDESTSEKRVSTTTESFEGRVQDLTSSLGDFGFVNEDDVDNLSAFINGRDGGAGDVCVGVGVGSAQQE